MGDDLDTWLTVMGGGWLALQVAALRVMSGGWRAAAWVPALAMGAALVIAVMGVLAGSNLAPIWVVLAIPLCFGWIVLLWVVRTVWWAISSARS